MLFTIYYNILQSTNTAVPIHQYHCCVSVTVTRVCSATHLPGVDYLIAFCVKHP